MDEFVKSLEDIIIASSKAIHAFRDAMISVASAGELDGYGFNDLVDMKDNLESREEYEACEKVQQEINSRLWTQKN